MKQLLVATNRICMYWKLQELQGRNLTDPAFLSQRTIARRRVIAGLFALPVLPLINRTVVAQEATPAAPTSSLGWTDSFDESNGKLNVATTVAPISSIVRNVGGTRINLRGIVPDGTNSHTFEPAPSDATILAAADLVIVNGLKLEEPTMELAEANLKDGAEIYSLGDRAITPDKYAYDFSFPEEDGKPNPHLWVNVPFAATYAELAEKRLSERDPINADYYRINRELYLMLLSELDQGIMAAVQTIPEQNRKLLTYHDSYAYFARHYGMTVIGAVQPSDFSEPSPKEVADLIDQIKEEGIPAVFGSEVFPSTVLEQIAKESGATYVDQLRDDDPPGEPGAPEHTYVGMMLKNMSLMVPALGGTDDALAGVEPWDTFVP
jgi:ABC-type Zn uptake system ZnuABC Zn-binding protein ZnuA